MEGLNAAAPSGAAPAPAKKLIVHPPDILEKAGVCMILDRGNVFYAHMLLQMDKEQTVMPRTTLGAGVYVNNGRLHLVYDISIWEEQGLKVDDIIYILKHEIGHAMLEHFSRRRGRNPQKWNYCTDFAINSILGKTTMPMLYPSNPPYNFPEDLSAEEYDKLMNDDKQPKREGGWVIIGGNKYRSGEHQENQEQNDDAMAELDREVMRQAVDEAYTSSKDKGNLPGKLEQLIDKILKKSRIDWKRALRQIVGTAAKVGKRLSWKKQSRRFGESSKGNLKKRNLGIICVVDTSGSMSDIAIGKCLAEVQGIQKSYRGCIVTVIECDAEIGKVYKLQPYGKPELKVSGRGGTSFKPPFAYIKKHKLMPDVLVYLTDLEGDFPEKPKFPVVWCATTDHSAPFGHVVRLPADINEEDD